MGKKTLGEGDVVLLSRGSMIGVVKYIGALPGQEGTFFGVKLGEGTGECDGTFKGTRYFNAPANKGVFISQSEIKKVISSEKLLDMICSLNKKLKQQNAEISKLNDELHLTKKQANENQKFSGEEQKIQPDSDEDAAIEQYLQNELSKKWFTTEEDLITRYNSRQPNEVARIFGKHKSKFEDLEAAAPHSRIVYTVCSSKRDNLVASGSDDKTIRLWRRIGKQANAQSRCIASIQLRSCINSLAFDPQGNHLAAALDSGWIELYDLGTGKMVGALEGQTTSEVWTISFSPDGSSLISGALDRAVRIWDVRERDCQWALRGHDEWVNGVSVAPDGLTIVSGSGDKTVRLWDTRNMSCRSTLRGHTDFVRSVCVTDDSKTVVSASDDCQLRVWDLQKAVCNTVLKGHSKGIYCVAAGKGRMVASASRDTTVKLWSVDNPKYVAEYKDHRGDVNSCTFVNNGQYIASGSDDKQVLYHWVKN